MLLAEIAMGAVVAHQRQHTVHDQLIEFVRKLEAAGGDLSQYGVTFTDLQKVGVNPLSRYNTPIGVYFYPLSYYRSLVIEDEGELPFKHDARYAHVLDLSGLNLAQMEDLDPLTLTEQLLDQITKVHEITKIPYDELEKFLTTDWEDRAQANALVDTTSGHAWYILHFLSYRSPRRATRSAAAVRGAVVWNALIRLLGYDGVVDDGNGIIHVNEQTQGVIVNTAKVKVSFTASRAHTGEIDLSNLRALHALGLRRMLQSITDLRTNRSIGQWARTLRMILSYYHDSKRSITKQWGKIIQLRSGLLWLAQELSTNPPRWEVFGGETQLTHPRTLFDIIRETCGVPEHQTDKMRDQFTLRIIAQRLRELDDANRPSGGSIRDVIDTIRMAEVYEGRPLFSKYKTAEMQQLENTLQQYRAQLNNV